MSTLMGKRVGVPEQFPMDTVWLVEDAYVYVNEEGEPYAVRLSIPTNGDLALLKEKP